MSRKRYFWILQQWAEAGHSHCVAWGGLHAAGLAVQDGFNVLVLTAKELQFRETESTPECDIVRVPYDDDLYLVSSPAFRERFETAAAALVERFKQPTKPVRMLITCAQGYNRSALLAARVAWLLTGASGLSIVGEIKKRREDALSNYAFRDWVESWPGKGV